jgi:hypothetical protein
MNEKSPPGDEPRDDKDINTRLVFKDSYTRKIKLTDVIFEEKIYPRAQHDTSLISKYRDAIDQLPPIVIDKKNRLIDGYHRLMAYSLEGKEEIEVTIFDSEDDRECLIESIKLNATHGKQLSQTEKKDLGRNLYLQGIEDAEILKILSISERTLRNYIRDLKEEQLSKRDAEIREMWLSKVPIRKIAEKVGLSKSRVEEIVSGFGNIAETGQPTVPQIFLNLWKNPEDFVKEKPKKLPIWVLENFLHKFTLPYDLVMEYGNTQTMSNLQIISQSWQRKYSGGTLLQDLEEVPSVILIDIPNTGDVVDNARKSFEEIARRTEKISDSDQPLIAFTISTDDWLFSTAGLEVDSIKNLSEFGFEIVGKVQIIYEMHPSRLEDLIEKTYDPGLRIRMEPRMYVIDQMIFLFSRNMEHPVAKIFREAEVFPKMEVTA